MAVLKRIGVLSCAKLEAIVMALFGLIIGIMMAILGSTMGAPMGAGLFAGMGILAIIVLPILYAVFGFIAGAIGAWIYNLVAGWIGGIEIELEK